MNSTHVSIICPCYNQSEFLVEAVDSVLWQDLQNWELIIINDGSTDNTLELATSYALQDSRIKVINQQNHGLSVSRNAGILASSGAWLHFLDADDKLLDNAFSTVLTYQNQDPKTDVIIASYSYFKGVSFFHSHFFDENVLGLESFFNSNIAPPVSFFIKKSCQEQVGLFDESLKSCEDWDFWIRAAKAGGKFKTIPDVLVGYRYVPTSMSRNAVQMYQALKEVSFRAVKKDQRIGSDLPLNQDYPADVEENLKYHFLRCLGVYLMQGNVSESINWFKGEKEKWNWKIQLKDFEGMNTYLSFRYFLEKNEIEHLLNNTLPDFEHFFMEIGFNDGDLEKAVRIVFAPQLKKRNHYRYGKWIGALINRLTF
ncbi:MAG: glycosyltransferase [Algoriphagus sp.]|uniref:glycosyltransferase n=1 Tax=Algoriphagus sp. TaxID=1872435 RepID=UPI002734B61E|nr:glycosyltransferase [Algoriphagus sp.]MDP3200384.1 glycosyltransferase [Algoriphagus sp.]